MPDVPNLSILTPKKEKPMEEIAPQNRLGHTIRSRRNVLEKSLDQVTAEIAKALGNQNFTNVVLGEIERGVRPATMDTLQAIARVLDISLEELRQHAIEWHEAIWDGKPRYELRPDATDATTIHTISHVEAMDELRGAVADMRRAMDTLRDMARAMKVELLTREADEATMMAALLEASINRIEAKLQPERAKLRFAQESEEGE